MDVAGPEDGGLPLAGIKRGDALTSLRDGPMDRAALMERLDVSRTTIHRIVRALEARDIVEQRGNEFELTTFGQTVADEVAAYRRRVRAAGHLKPFLETTPDLPVELDVGLFQRAQVTETEPTNPYGPVARFMELLVDSETLYGFDTTTIAPIYVDEIRDEILGGMETDVVYLPSVVEDIVDTYATEIAAAVESGHLTLSTHEDLPFGLAVFDDRVGLGGYDSETGMLRAFVDTADPGAREWALDLYERYREAATPMELPSGASD
jgi:predicted transcriptional regulator